MSKGITFDSMKEAKKYGDQMAEQGYEVDITKKGKNKFVVKTSELVEVEGEDGISGEATAHKTVIGKAEGTLNVVSGKGVSRMLRSPADMKIGGTELNPHLYDPTKGGQTARIAQLPKIKFEDLTGK